ncbi:hypothetical protein JHK82_040075 [Glycine max]|nr:hypothetical protein JHK82_040075 [Glycine max]KAG5122147.1 hypothetical protein JHK84_040487 [Glycine max]
MVVCDSAPINPKEENSSNMNKSSVTTEEREETGFIKEKPTIEEVNNSSSTESGLHSLDESNISEIEEESNDDRLRRQIE